LNMNETALVTGASDRIGKEIALTFAEMGYDIALHYCSSEESAHKTRLQILEKGVHCSVFQADFKNSAEAISLIEGVRSKGDVRFLVNNASIFTESSIFDSDYDAFDEILNINFKAPYILTKEFARLSKKGTIINILDTQISRQATHHFDYLLTKKSLEDFTRMAALHLAPDIRVNGIAPGLILPPGDRDIEYLKGLAKKIPQKRVGDLGCIKGAIQYLVDNPFVTGQIIYVDGGENLL
jgi:pteridine reductase